MWLESIEKIESEMHMDYFTVFFKQLSPSFLGRNKDVLFMKELLKKHQDSDKTYLCKLLKEEINTLEEVIELKAMK